MKYERITVDPAVMVGKPCIKGTRITAEHILREMSAGTSIAELLVAHPGLADADIREALSLAAALITNDDIELASPQ
jgi:uncharacterized protein (DUF433 family)